MKMVMKKILALGLSAATVMSMTACGASDATTETKAAETKAATEAAAGTTEAADSTEAVGATEAAGSTEAAGGDTASVDTSILEGKKISFLTSQGKFFDEYNTMAEAIKADYGCEVEFQVVPDNEYYSLLKVKLSTSEVPDVFEYNFPTQNADIGAAEYCEDLSSEAWASRLVNPDLIKDPNDGKLYALPKESSSSYMAVYYNKDVLESCGITDPHPKTYAEFLDILKTVKEKGNGVTPLYMTNADTWTTQIFMTCGYSVALGDKAEETYSKLLKNEIKWTDVPEFEEVLTNYTNLIKDGYVNEDHLSAGYDTAPEKLGTGKVAMYLTIEQCAADTIAKYPDAKLGSFVIPYGDNDSLPTGAYVQGLFVPKSGSQTDVAKAFLSVWSDPKIQSLYYKTKPGFPAFSDVDGGKVVDCVQSLVDNYIAKGNYSYQLNDEMAECSTIWPDLWNYYVESAADTKTPKEVFETFQTQYIDFMQQQGVEGF